MGDRDDVVRADLNELAGRGDEPMAVIKCDFFSWAGGQIRGEYTIDHASDARTMCEKLNDIWGDGTHWVETLNETKSEREARARSEKAR